MSKFKLGDRVRAANPLWDASEEETLEVWRVVSRSFFEVPDIGVTYLVENAKGQTGVMAEVEMELVKE
jgi:hypothetical protein